MKRCLKSGLRCFKAYCRFRWISRAGSLWHFFAVVASAFWNLIVWIISVMTPLPRASAWSVCHLLFYKLCATTLYTPSLFCNSFGSCYFKGLLLHWTPQCPSHGGFSARDPLKLQQTALLGYPFGKGSQKVSETIWNQSETISIYPSAYLSLSKNIIIIHNSNYLSTMTTSISLVWIHHKWFTSGLL